MWSIHTMGYDSALKRKEILTQATTWMDFEDLMLAEISWSQKGRSCLVPLNEVPKAVKFIETEGGMGVAGGWEEGERGVSF